MTRADDAGDWRDLADQLTPEQVAELERTEQSWERVAQSRSRYLRNASTSGDDQRRELHVSGGVEVVSADGLAASAELRAGDVLLSMNNVDITSAKQFNDLVAHLDPKKPVFVLMRRGDAARYVPLRPGS